MTSTAAPAAAPDYIAPDTYAGTWTASAHTLRADTRPTPIAAGTLAAEAATGVLWVSFGTPRGMRHEKFSRTRFVADAEGRLHCYDSSGRKVVIHPADRVLRVLRRFV